MGRAASSRRGDLPDELHRRWVRWRVLKGCLVLAATIFGVIVVRDAFTSTSSASPQMSRATTPPQVVGASTTIAPTLPTTPATVSALTLPTSSAVADALRQLGQLIVGPVHPGGFERDLFYPSMDVDGDGCASRMETIIAESFAPPVVAAGCKVESGLWYSAYDGATITDPTELSVDQVVPLREAWASGAWDWTSAQRLAYGNDVDDPLTMAAVSIASDDAKSNSDPSGWLPSNPTYVCQYVIDWIAIKVRWDLSMDQAEYDALRRVLRGAPCTSA